MRVIAISRVRNEADIIEPFVRHALAYCTLLIVMDHGSTDATGEILDKLKAEGLALHITRDATPGKLQVDQMKRLLGIAAEEFAADWIFPLDADEFISGATDLSFLPGTVDDDTRCLKVPMRTYYSRRDDAVEPLNPVERITHRLIHEPEEIYKVFVPGPLARQPDCYLAQGNHRFMLATREAPFDMARDVYLAHFSLRNPSQYAAKLAASHLQSLRRVAPRGCESAHYRKAYEKLRKSYSTMEKNFHECRLTYLPAHDVNAVVADPVRYLGGPLRHTPQTGHADEFVEQLLAMAEALAQPERNPQEGGGGLRSAGHPVLSVEAYADPGEIGGAVRRVPGDPASVHLLRFDLACKSDTRELRLCFGCEPGMLEIYEITLRFAGERPTARTYGPEALKHMLRVLRNGAAILSENEIRIMISAEPVLTALRNWRQGDEPTPHALELKVRYRNRFLERIFLDPNVLNVITHESAENEIFRAHLGKMRYETGSDIDFSDGGDGTLYQHEGWSSGEQWGTWTEGEKASMKIRFANAPDGGLCLSVVARAFVQPAHPEVRVNVRLNGEMVAEWGMTNGDFEEYRAAIPAGLIPEKECEVVFEIENPVSPKEKGLSDDARRLGMGVRSMRLERAEKLDL